MQRIGKSLCSISNQFNIQRQYPRFTINISYTIYIYYIHSRSQINIFYKTFWNFYSQIIHSCKTLEHVFHFFCSFLSLSLTLKANNISYVVFFGLCLAPFFSSKKEIPTPSSHRTFSRSISCRFAKIKSTTKIKKT